MAFIPLLRARAPTPPSRAGHSLLEYVGRGIHQPGIDPTGFLQRKQIGCVFRVAEYIAAGLVDWYGS